MAQERLEFEVRRTSATIDEESRSYASFLDDHSASMMTRLQNSIADTTKNNETLVKILVTLMCTNAWLTSFV